MLPVVPDTPKPPVVPETPMFPDVPEMPILPEDPVTPTFPEVPVIPTDPDVLGMLVPPVWSSSDVGSTLTSTSAPQCSAIMSVQPETWFPSKKVPSGAGVNLKEPFVSTSKQPAKNQFSTAFSSERPERSVFSALSWPLLFSTWMLAWLFRKSTPPPCLFLLKL